MGFVQTVTWGRLHKPPPTPLLRHIQLLPNPPPPLLADRYTSRQTDVVAIKGFNLPFQRRGETKEKKSIVSFDYIKLGSHTVGLHAQF